MTVELSKAAFSFLRVCAMLITLDALKGFLQNELTVSVVCDLQVITSILGSKRNIRWNSHSYY